MINEKNKQTSLKHLSQRMLMRMDDLKLTQTALAKKIGVAQSAISKWLAPTSPARPTVAQLISLSQALDVSIDWLLGADATVRSTYNVLFRTLCAIADRTSDTLLTDEYLGYLLTCYQTFVKNGVSDNDIAVWQSRVDSDFEVPLLPAILCTKRVYNEYLELRPDLRATDDYTQHLRTLLAIQHDLMTGKPSAAFEEFEEVIVYDSSMDIDTNDIDSELPFE